MLPASLRRHVCHGALQNLQQCLLNAFTGHVPGDGGVLALSCDLIHLVDVNDAPLGKLHIKVRRLQKPQQDIFHIVAHIARFRQRGGVGNGEGDVQNLCQGLGEQSLAAACGADEQNIALLQLHLRIRPQVNPLIVVVHRHGQGYLRVVLTDDVPIHKGLHFHGRGQMLRSLQCLRSIQIIFLPQQIAAGLHAIAANIHPRPGNQPGCLILPLTAEAAANRRLLVILCHAPGTSFLR